MSVFHCVLYATFSFFFFGCGGGEAQSIFLSNFLYFIFLSGRVGEEKKGCKIIEFIYLFTYLCWFFFCFILFVVVIKITPNHCQQCWPHLITGNFLGFFSVLSCSECCRWFKAPQNWCKNFHLEGGRIRKVEEKEILTKKHCWNMGRESTKIGRLFNGYF